MWPPRSRATRLNSAGAALVDASVRDGSMRSSASSSCAGQLQDGLSHHRIEHIALGEQSRCQDLERRSRSLRLSTIRCEEIVIVQSRVSPFRQIVDETMGEESSSPRQARRCARAAPRRCAYHLAQAWPTNVSFVLQFRPSSRRPRRRVRETSDAKWQPQTQGSGKRPRECTRAKTSTRCRTTPSGCQGGLVAHVQ